jgi:cytosine deaminase
MVMAGHVLPDDAYAMVSARTRQMMGLPRAGTDIGQVADLVLVPAASTREAIATGPVGRTVVRAGTVIA